MGGINSISDLPNSCYDYRHEERRVKIVDVCLTCGEFILEGEKYYDVRGMRFCIGCMDDYLITGE